MTPLLRFLFKGEVEKPVVVRRVRVEDSDKEPKRSGNEAADMAPRVHRFWLIRFCSRVLAAVLLISLAGLLYMVMAGEKVPDVLPPLITAIVGYFGGAVSAYFGVTA